jgi:dipeptidyl aminopeptidase/acylaminoacyl peptidase
LLICAAALGLLLAGCRAQPAALSPAVPTASAAPGLNAAETLPPPAVRTATNTPAPSLTPTPQNTATPSPSPTVDRYAGLRIPYLAAREYGGGEIEVVQTLAENSYFTRLLIRYPSDGLTIYGFMNVPVRGEPPYPVVIANHGYIEPEIYDTIDYTTRYADSLARAGFLVLHPNLRGYPPSDSGDNLFRVGMAIDVLNLIALVQEQAGKPGPLELADPGAIGLWGHSMGGGVSTRVLTVSQAVDAAVLYAAMSPDERQNFEAINRWSYGQRGLDELAVPVEELETISPAGYLDQIQAAVSIHHGRSDELVPLRWSIDLCDQLNALGKEVECYWYEGQPHTFYGAGDELFMQRVIDFFNRELRE